MNSTPLIRAAQTLRRSCCIVLLATAGLQTASAELVAWWTFDAPGTGAVVPDTRAGLPAKLMAGAVLTADGGGRTGAPGDRAAHFGTGNQRMHLANAGYFTAAAAGNVLSVSYWIRQNQRSATPISLVAPSIGGRGFQAHTPWSDSTIYFDTGGCCTGGVHRTAIFASYDWTQWHHITLVKDGNVKTIYVDGTLLQTGNDSAPISLAFTELLIGNGPTTTEAVDGEMDDVAIFSHALSGAEALALAGGDLPTALPGVSATDSDSDSLPDLWEYRSFPGDLTQLTSLTQDQDGDGLDNGTELSRGTNPGNADTDADGAADGVETDTGTWVSLSDRGTSPFVPDTDADRLLDGVETNTGIYVSASNTGTNPFTKDYDGDLVEDGLEVAYGSNPVNSASTPITPGVPTLLAWWRFDNNSSPGTATDTRAGHVGVLQGSAAYSADGAGSSGLIGDRALSITGGGGKMRLESAPWINMGTRLDKLTLSFWQKNTLPTPAAGQSSFWFVSPTAGGLRGFQSHCPWSGSTVYFDTAGCCLASQRINAVMGGHDWSQWHHYVYIKDGASKRFYIDGVERMSGGGAAPLQQDFTALNIGSDNGGGSMLGLLDEFAVFAAPLTAQEITDLATRAKTPLEIATSPDADADTLPDAWEFIWFPGDLTRLGAPPADYDSDGSTDANELAKLSNPTNSDSDNDTLLDGVETATGVWVSPSDRGTSPINADSDGDFMIDGWESNSGVYVSPSDPGTNPNDPDSDNDTFLDGFETAYDSNPLNAGSVPFTAGQTFLLAHWPFDDAGDPAEANDVVVGFHGAATGTYTADAGGHSGSAGDRAMGFIPNQSVTATAVYMNLASANDAISIAFWQKLTTVSNSSAFWVTSPNPLLGGRGIQAHVPWGDFTMYFDHGGCCDAGVHRIQGPLPPIDPTLWQHFAFVKNGSTKQIYVNGVLAVDGLGSAPLPTDLHTLTIGGGLAGHMDGYLDDFAVFAGALSAEQLTRLSRGESPSTVLQPLPRGFEITGSHFNPGGTYHLEWSSIANYRYTVEASTTLEPGSWVPLTGFVPSGGAVTMVDVTLPPGPRVFLRVVQ